MSKKRIESSCISYEHEENHLLWGEKEKGNLYEKLRPNLVSNQKHI